MANKRLQILIHDLNTWGGQDRSMLEIAHHLSRLMSIDIHSFTLADPSFPNGWGDARFIPVHLRFRRPVLIKILFYYAAIAMRRRKSSGQSIAVGACALNSNFVQVQFLHAPWKAQAETNPKWGIRPLYHAFMLHFNTLAERLIFRGDKTYVAIAECVKQELIDFYAVPEKNIHVIHHGVDPRTFCPPEEESRSARLALREKLGVRENENLALFVGAYERKGLEASIHALALLQPETRAHLKLVAVGNGDRPRYEELARRLGVSANVILHGVSQHIQEFYRAADLFLLPTLYEPFGLVILEAMASGLPAVVSSRAGASELIKNGENGLLIVNPADPREIASQLARVLEDENLRRTLGLNARKTALCHSWEEVSRKYHDVFKSHGATR